MNLIQMFSGAVSIFLILGIIFFAIGIIKFLTGGKGDK